MLPYYYRSCCENCENLRIDNFCLIKGKYILTKNTSKRRDCTSFSPKKSELFNTFKQSQKNSEKESDDEITLDISFD